jgi:hypothetical protein
MDVIEEIKARLQEYPDAKFESSGNSIRVLPSTSDGFTVSLAVNQDSYTVSFNGWHEDFQDRAEALDCFAFGLSPECRLKEYWRGNVACKWTVESQENGEWIEDSTTGLLIFPFWMKKQIRYLQNTLMSAGRDASNADPS